ncbi:hypothetical protein G9A89_016635 [Geosiphon pyriformis]|nr:hypothetical protein G9A89_016635 [Geosiphon pyriformis]
MDHMVPIKKHVQSLCQQPIRARMCGFGEKDRRPIDPPTILQLKITYPDGSPVPENSVPWERYVVHADLWCKNQKEERSLVVNPASIPHHSKSINSSIISLNSPTHTRTLVGSINSNAYVLTNHEGQRGIYFIFQDLSVRTEGQYTLHFSFTALPSNLFGGCGHLESRVVSLISADVFTKPFTVYSAKKFPGMTDSTELSKAFAKQGIKISIRKDDRARRTPISITSLSLINVKDSFSPRSTSTSTLSEHSSENLDIEDTQKRKDDAPIYIPIKTIKRRKRSSQ